MAKASSTGEKAAPASAAPAAKPSFRRRGDGFLHCARHGYLPEQEFGRRKTQRHACKQCEAKARSERRQKRDGRRGRPGKTKLSQWSGLSSDTNTIRAVSIGHGRTIALTSAELSSLGPLEKGDQRWAPLVDFEPTAATTVEQLLLNVAEVTRRCGQVPPLYRRALQRAMAKSAKRVRKK